MFCSTFLLNFFTIYFLLLSLLSFWLSFSRCRIIWAFLSSPLTALVCCSFIPCSYLLYLEWNHLLWRSFEKISLRQRLIILCLALLTYFCLLLPCARYMLVTFYSSFSALLLLGNEHFVWAPNSLVTCSFFRGLKKCSSWMTSSNLLFCLIWHLCLWIWFKSAVSATVILIFRKENISYLRGEGHHNCQESLIKGPCLIKDLAYF